MHGRRSLPALVAVALLLAGCGNPSPSDSPAPTASSVTPSPATSSSASPSLSSAPETPIADPPTSETPSATAAPTPTSRPVVVRPVPPSALPVRSTAYRMGQGIGMAPLGDGGVYVAIPDREGTLLVALDDNLRVRLGWPLLIEGRSCTIAADVADGSVRAVCSDDTSEALGFDRDGRPLDGWPVRLPQRVYPWTEPRVIGGDLYLGPT